MQIKTIKCPTCSAVLSVKNNKVTNNQLLAGENGVLVKSERIISCPNCKSLLRVKFSPEKESIKQEPIDAHTFLVRPKPQASDGETVLENNSSFATQLVTPRKSVTATAKLVFNGRDYPLREGRNIIGRRGNTSAATIQIPTDDHYMSRQHCCVNVTTLSDGSKKAVISNYQNKNMTTVNGQQVNTGDEIRLTDGDAVTMGHSTVIFKQS